MLGQKQRGFTLIELVVVIVLIGILAATVLPKFTNLTTQARNSANAGIAGSVASAVNMAHAAWIANGAPTGASTITLEGTSISVSGSGWPTATTAAECVSLITNLMSSSSGVNFSVAGCPVTAGTTCYNTAYAASTCTYTYYTAGGTLPTFTYNATTGAVASQPAP